MALRGSPDALHGTCPGCGRRSRCRRVEAGEPPRDLSRAQPEVVRLQLAVHPLAAHFDGAECRRALAAAQVRGKRQRRWSSSLEGEPAVQRDADLATESHAKVLVVCEAKPLRDVAILQT